MYIYSSKILLQSLWLTGLHLLLTILLSFQIKLLRTKRNSMKVAQLRGNVDSYSLKRQHQNLSYIYRTNRAFDDLGLRYFASVYYHYKPFVESQETACTSQPQWFELTGGFARSSQSQFGKWTDSDVNFKDNDGCQGKDWSDRTGLVGARRATCNTCHLSSWPWFKWASSRENLSSGFATR